jgi:hypothetical protein
MFSLGQGWPKNQLLRGCLVEGIGLGNEGIPNHLVMDNHFFCLVV